MKAQHSNVHSPLFVLFCLLALGTFLGPRAFLGKWAILGSLGIFWVFIPLRLPALFLYRLRYGSFLILSIFVGLYVGRPQTNPQDQKELEFFNCKTYEGVGLLIKPISQNSFGKKSWIKIYYSRSGSLWQKSHGKAVAFIPLEMEAEWEKFDIVHFRGNMISLYSPYPSYLDYLHKQGLSHQVYVDKMEKIGSLQGLLPTAYQIQQRTANRLDHLFRDSIQLGLIKAMMLGEKSELDRNVRQDFAVAGISHVLAISGMHVGIIFLILDKLLFFMAYFRAGYSLKQIIILLCLIGFMLVSGASPAVVRATLMLSAILVAKLTRQRYQSLNLVSLTGILQLLYEPRLIFDLGFQLSYVAVFALIIVYPIWERRFRTGIGWKDALLSWIGVSIVATAATSPLIWITFGSFPTYFLLTNVVLSFPITLLVWFGFLCVLFSAVPVLNVCLAKLCEWLICLVLGTIEQVGRLPYAVLQPDEAFWPGIQYLVLELLLGVILVWCLRRKK